MNTAVSALGSGIKAVVPLAAGAAAGAIADALKDRVANNVVDQIEWATKTPVLKVYNKLAEARKALQVTAKDMINSAFPGLFPKKKSLPKKIKAAIEKNLKAYVATKEQFGDEIAMYIEEKIFKPVDDYIHKRQRQQEKKQQEILGTGAFAGASTLAPAALNQLRNLFQTDDEIDELGEAAAIPIVGAVKRTPAKIKYYNLFRAGRNVNAKPSQSILNFLKYKL